MVFCAVEEKDPWNRNSAPNVTSVASENLTIGNLPENIVGTNVAMQNQITKCWDIYGKSRQSVHNTSTVATSRPRACWF